MPVQHISAPIEIPSAFHIPVQSLSPEDQGYRRIDVTEATEYLEVPGLVEIDELKIGAYVVPAYEDHVVPIDTTETRFNTLRLRNYALSEVNGKQCLLRGKNSNDGKWQAGAVLFVKGTWSDDVSDDLTNMTLKDLKPIAEELGIPHNRVARHDLIGLIRNARKA